MNRKALRMVAYAGTGVIALDRFREAVKTGDAFDYVIAGGIAASLALQVVADREIDNMRLAASISPARVDDVGFAGAITTAAGAAARQTYSNPSLWASLGTTFLDIAKNAGGQALGAWAASEIGDSGGGGGGGGPLIISGGQAPTDYRRDNGGGSGGLSNAATVGIIAVGGILGVTLLVLLVRR